MKDIWSKGDKIQFYIALILFVTLIVLSLNLKFFWKQNELTQILNQPLCAIKEIKVNKARDHVIEISAIIKNFGNYVAKNASINWESYEIENIKDEKPVLKKREDLSSKRKTQITILPQHEFKHL